MGRFLRLHPVANGALVGAVFSLLGGTIALDIIGFWLGGLLVLPFIAVASLVYIHRRHRKAKTTLLWALGCCMGLAPVAGYFATRSSHFGFELLLPMTTGLCVAVIAGPLYLRAANRTHRESKSIPPAT